MNLEVLLAWADVLDPSIRWMVKVFVLVFATLLLGYLVDKVLNRIHLKFQANKSDWDDAILEAARGPIRYFIWLIGFCWAGEIVYRVSGAEIFSIVDNVRRVGVIFLLTWFVVRFIRYAENILVEPKPGKEAADRTTVHAIGNLLRASFVITGVLVALQTLGYSISGVLAFGGIGGIAIGFAARDLLANFFGGMMIFLDRPFTVGDWVRSPDKNIEGTVENIGWRVTRIRTFDKRPLYVPNATFTNISVENPSRMSHRRIYETLGIRYSDTSKMAAIVDEVKAMLQAHADIDSSQTMIVNFNAFAASSVNFFVYTFTHTTNWVEFHKVKQDVLLKISDIVESHGAEFAFPTSTIHVPDAVKLDPHWAGLEGAGKEQNP